MSKRYELSDAEWEIVADLFSAHRRTGRPRVDDRLMLNGVLWVLCSGATWRDMPERFGPWSINDFETGETKEPSTKCSSGYTSNSMHRARLT